jgi:hypothetical protein
MNNHEIARQLTAHARMLAAEAGNVYRIRAYRQAAQTVAWMDQPLAAVLEEKGARAGGVAGHWPSSELHPGGVGPNGRVPHLRQRGALRGRCAGRLNDGFR